MISLGIDIGLSGALCAVRGEQMIGLEDMPTREKPGASTVRREIDARALHEAVRRILGPYRCEAVVHLENVYGMRDPKKGGAQGAASVFSFGDTRGVIRSVLELMGLEVRWIAPVTWKRHFRLDREKGAALTLARRLYPEAPLELVKHHNRAEALLLARFGYERCA